MKCETLPPGSGSDLGARFYAEQLARLSGAAVTVRNIPGGNGFIAVIDSIGENFLLWFQFGFKVGNQSIQIEAG